ncbi:hypothetical protein K491DRAFT_692026 [Lophiostoma macrostomum CBS 122681]|uniref:Uncharacterized protein n=1 Tax=Lophiostoma macrostomum CBS 122681 TaxID=1314788 RepID=A0A6A6TC57_9PLEO|nr:hypothetical protein K491DRAFT_692026 [Lophiostoma macrostomum CBS 122681]
MENALAFVAISKDDIREYWGFVVPCARISTTTSKKGRLFTSERHGSGTPCPWLKCQS